MCKLKKLLNIIYTLIYVGVWFAWWVFLFKDMLAMWGIFFGILGIMTILGMKYKIGCCS